jgi:hypothetical protein
MIVPLHIPLNGLVIINTDLASMLPELGPLIIFPTQIILDPLPTFQTMNPLPLLLQKISLSKIDKTSLIIVS